MTLFDTFCSSPFQPTSVAAQTPAPLEVYAQMGVLDPSLLDGIALSALVGLEIVTSKGGPVPGPMGNDDARLVDLTSTFASATQVTFSQLQQYVFYQNPDGPAAMVYELSQGVAPTPTSQIIFPIGDTSIYMVVH